MKRFSGLTYGCTDESLLAISEGLRPTSKDYILSVTGSGDPAFWLASFSSKIDAVDISQAQTDFFKYRTNCLRLEDQRSFLCLNAHDERYIPEVDGGDLIALLPTTHFQRRNQLMEKKDILQKIRMNLSLLRTLPTGDIVQAAEMGIYNKIYFNNIMRGMGPQEASKLLTQIGEKLPLGGLVYLTDSTLVKGYRGKLVIEEELSKAAQAKYEEELGYMQGPNRVVPAVFKKIV